VSDYRLDDRAIRVLNCGEDVDAVILGCNAMLSSGLKMKAVGSSKHASAYLSMFLPKLSRLPISTRGVATQKTNTDTSQQIPVTTGRVYWISYGVVSHKGTHALQSFFYLSCVPISVVVIHDSSTRALWQTPADT
jgi:hypothetical protein